MDTLVGVDLLLCGRTRLAATISIIGVALTICAACDDPGCPSGTTLMGERCVALNHLFAGDASPGSTGPEVGGSSAGSTGGNMSGSIGPAQSMSAVMAAAGNGGTSGEARGDANGSTFGAGVTAGSTGAPQSMSVAGASGNGGAGEAARSGSNTSGAPGGAGAGGTRQSGAGGHSVSESCGDGVVGTSETCDFGSTSSPCPSSCEDDNPCTADSRTGSAAQCNVVCMHVPIVMLRNADGCFPPNANAVVDTDCHPVCGNGVQEAGEICDGNCASSCDDGDACTSDRMNGSTSSCDVACNHTTLAPGPRDGCCPRGANMAIDADCAARCGDGVVSGHETCDPASQGQGCPMSCDDGNPCTSDSLTGSSQGCDAACSHVSVHASNFSAREGIDSRIRS